KTIPLKHCNAEAVYRKLLQPLEGKQYAIYGLADSSLIPPLHNRFKYLKNRLMIFTRTKSEEKYWEKYLKEFNFWGIFCARYIPFCNWNKLRAKQFYSIDCFDVESLIKDPVVSLSAIFRLLEEPGIFSLYLEESERYDKFIFKLLKKADMGEVIGLLEKVGFQSPFLIQNLTIKPKTFVRIRSRKNCFHEKT
ncbi:MAG: hypothetical protein KAH01_00005, partial [Caldisericia bacterium]|nr:hypothetical protein [Caldisericia bacterium]